MANMTQINPSIHRLVIPYKDIFTTVYTVRYEGGVLLFDAAAENRDVDEYILPMLEQLQVTREELKYIFISHNHRDHAGGLSRVLELYPDACVVSGADANLEEKLGGARHLVARDGDELDGVFRMVTIPGHTVESSALLDKRTNTLITGDCLQLYGIFGSTDWACAISLPAEHLRALDKVRALQVDEILTAHDYHPFGYHYVGREAVERALDACAQPLLQIKQIILNRPDMDDEGVRAAFNALDHRPTVSTRIVGAVRKAMDSGML